MLVQLIVDVYRYILVFKDMLVARQNEQSMAGRAYSGDLQPETLLCGHVELCMRIGKSPPVGPHIPTYIHTR